jgi:hypothetical protein
MGRGRRRSQAQLQRYGFTTSHPHPTIRHVFPGEFYNLELAICFCSYPPFYDHIVGNLVAYITRQLESLIQRGNPGFKIPKIRIVHVTDAKGKRDLEDLRARYWSEREELPSKEDLERFVREDMDARIVARPPSPFDLQYADDLEVCDEIFREGLMQCVSEIHPGDYGY